MKTLVIASVRVPGLHRWENCTFEDVIYLKAYHRHEFHIKVKKSVSHTDRDVEIIRLKNNIVHYLQKKYPPINSNGSTRECFFGNMSCEQIAEDLIKEFDLHSCEVLEDGENGAELINELYIEPITDVDFEEKPVVEEVKPTIITEDEEDTF